MTPSRSIPRRDLLRVAGIAAVGLCVAVSSAFAQGTSDVPPSRLARLATGTNVCLWFRSPPKDSPKHFANYISAAEAEYMARMGLKHVRLCVEPSVIMARASGDIVPGRGEQLEAAIERFHRAGLMVVVDIHNTNYDDEIDPKWQDSLVRCWGLLAARLSRFDPEWTILETINEPNFCGRTDEWNRLDARLVAAIRHGAPRHTIITSGPDGGSVDGLKKLKLLPDRNVIYSFHCYDPFPFTHQSASWTIPAVRPLHDVPYPSSPEAVKPLLAELQSKPDAKQMVESYGNERWNKGSLAARFREGIEWGAKNHVPLYCGEFGVYAARSKPADRARWFRDFGEVLAENRIGWAVWGWDECFGLDRKMVDGKPVVDAVVARSLGLKP
ncbi:MAG: glycoside hydrolase family 5 protein [Planctomycetaceae bacterium]|nr:glycoside hydrolase family 5 protein [Planctomycetaceae bacterium]